MILWTIVQTFRGVELKTEKKQVHNSTATP